MCDSDDTTLFSRSDLFVYKMQQSLKENFKNGNKLIKPGIAWCLLLKFFVDIKRFVFANVSYIWSEEWIKGWRWICFAIVFVFVYVFGCITDIWNKKCEEDKRVERSICFVRTTFKATPDALLFLLMIFVSYLQSGWA